MTKRHRAVQGERRKFTVTCPNCSSTHDHRVIWGLRNLGVVVGNTLWYLLQVAAMVFVTHAGWALRRKCFSCGYAFYGPKPEPPDFNECARCGYNLTGNVSGRCSECGWKLPRRYRAYRRKNDQFVREQHANRSKNEA